ncbi:CapA family protein [Candidatus Dojkabacteria bacterium]|nr:CapA family protein [Candidatus Dojkabacteria bacterium]
MYRVEVKRDHRAKGKPRLRVAIIILLLLFFISVFWLIYQKFRPIVQNRIEEEELVEVNYKRYFVVQKEFSTLENNVEFSELKQLNIACFKENEEEIKNLLGINEISLIEGDVYEWMKKQDISTFILLEPARTDFRLKTLSIDGVYIWEKGADLANYPLYYEESQQIEKSKAEEWVETNFDSSFITTYVAAGEIIPSRAVARKFRRTGDYKYPFYNVQDLFWNADFSSAVLENSMLGMPEPCYGCTWFTSDEAFMEGLVYSQIDVLTPGNHFMDGGIKAVSRTIDLLDEAEIKHSGFSKTDLDDASQPAIYEVDGFKFAFLGYDDVAWFHWAGPTWGGVATVSQRFDNGTKKILTDKIESDVKRAKELADYVIVIMSWGDREYINWPLENQKQMGHAFIDAGADLVLGTHQHWVNTVEIYDGKFIFYGMGNFVFDQTHTDPTRQGVILEFYFFEKRLVSAKIIPHQTCGYHQTQVDDENCTHFQPQILDETDPVYKIIWDRMFEYSEI